MYVWLCACMHACVCVCLCWQQAARVWQQSFRVGISDCAESTVDDLGVILLDSGVL